MKKTLLLLLLFFFPVSITMLAQKPETDSLLKALAGATADTQRVNILNDLSSLQDKPESKQKYAEEILKISEKTGYIKGLTWGYNLLGAVARSRADFKLALKHYGKSLEMLEVMNDSLGVAKLNNNIGEIYRLQGVYPTALSYYLKSLAMLELLNKPKYVATSMNNIAIIYRYQKNYAKALEYNMRSLAIREKLKIKSEIADSYDNIGIIYYEQKKYAEAIKNISKSLTLKIEAKDTAGIASSYNNISNVYSESGNLAKGLEYQQKALAMREYLHDKRGISMSYNNLGNIHYLLNDYRKAMDYQVLALNLAREIGSRELIKNTYESLVTLNKSKKDFEQAFHYQSLLGELKDSMLNVETNAQMAEMQTKYETEKKDLEITNKTLELDNKSLELNHRNTQLLILIISLVIVVLLSYLFYSRYKFRQKEAFSKAMLEQQSMRSKAVIDAEERERMRIAQELHDGIGQQLSAVKLNMSGLQSSLPLESTEQKLMMQHAIEIIDDSVKEVRNVSHSMMPNALLKSGLATAVREFLNRINTTEKLKFELEIYGLNERLENTTEIIMFRVLQEITNNIIRHSKATKVMIQLTRDENELTMMVEDNGIGFDPEKSSEGIGLRNIRSRIEFLNGTVHFDSKANVGTTISIDVPVK